MRVSDGRIVHRSNSIVCRSKSQTSERVAYDWSGSELPIVQIPWLELNDMRIPIRRLRSSGEIVQKAALVKHWSRPRSLH